MSQSYQPSSGMGWIIFQIPGDVSPDEVKKAIEDWFGPYWAGTFTYTGNPTWYQCESPENPERLRSHLPAGVTMQVMP